MFRTGHGRGFPRSETRRLEFLTSSCADDGLDGLCGGVRAIPRHDTGRLGIATPCCFTSGRCCRCLRIEHTERHERDDASVAADRRRGRRCLRKHSYDGRRRLKQARCVSLRQTISVIDGRGHDAVFASGAGLLSADCPSRRASRSCKLASCPRWARISLKCRLCPGHAQQVH